MDNRIFTIAVALIFAAGLTFAHADVLMLKDGTTLDKCFIRDEGIRLLVWDKMEDVGSPNFRIVPRSQIKRYSNDHEYKIERDESYNTHPSLPDLMVSFIEMTPKLPGLHGLVDYDNWGRPVLKGKPLVDLGEETAMKPAEAAKNLKLAYTPGQDITLTAHVRNVGFADAKPFEYVWLIDGKEVSRGKQSKALKEMAELTFPLKWKWQDGMHTATFKITTVQPEIATINNSATDPLWGWGYTFVVNKGRIKAWHQNRTASGTFCFEDYYRWHVEMMNVLFENSIYPSAPDGIKARVRLDKIIYCDDVEAASKATREADGIQYLGGAWTWGGEEETKKQWIPGKAYETEWSLPHELGHQLGITDWYGLDYEGTDDHVWPDNGEKIAHFMTHPDTMMHDHGPNLFSEVDAGYLNATWNMPRGHFGDYYFAIPKECFLRIVDVNGLGVPGAKVEIFQRAVKTDPSGQPAEDQGVKYYPVVEDGDFYTPAVSKDPVIVGATDEDGVMRLPNRPVKEVITLNGYHRLPNPFGNINVVGNRGIMMVKVTKNDRPAFFYLEIYDFNLSWFRGQKDRYTTVLRTPFGSVSSPLAPEKVAVAKTDDTHVKVSWAEPKVKHERQYLERVIGYRVYRRVGPMSLSDRPWFPVATLGPDATEFVVDLKPKPEDCYWYSLTDRFAVSSLGELSMESELVEAPMEPFKR